MQQEKEQLITSSKVDVQQAVASKEGEQPLRDKLNALRPIALHKRALHLVGSTVGEDALDRAMSLDDPKPALVEMLVGHHKKQAEALLAKYWRDAMLEKQSLALALELGAGVEAAAEPEPEPEPSYFDTYQTPREQAKERQRLARERQRELAAEEERKEAEAEAARQERMKQAMLIRQGKVVEAGQPEPPGGRGGRGRARGRGRGGARGEGDGRRERGGSPVSNVT